MQTVLTAYYKDIKGIQGACCCPKTKVVKCNLQLQLCKYEDQEDTWTTPDKDAATDAADAATPATPQHGGAAAATGWVEPPLASSTASSPAPNPGGKGSASKLAAGGGMLRPKPDAD